MTDNREQQRALTLLMRELAESLPDPVPTVTHVPRPSLPKGQLSQAEKWKSLLWAIDTAEAHGTTSLKRLSIVLAQMLLFRSVESIVFDARLGKESPNTQEDLLWDRNLSIDAAGSKLSDLLERQQTSMALELLEATVLPSPWNTERLAKSLQNLGAGQDSGPWKQTPNFRSICWKPWPLVWVTNGNHSTAVALLTDGGHIEPDQCYDATPLLSSVFPDGKNWRRAGDNSILAPIKSLHMAGIYEVGRRLAGMKSPN